LLVVLVLILCSGILSSLPPSSNRNVTPPEPTDTNKPVSVTPDRSASQNKIDKLDRNEGPTKDSVSVTSEQDESKTNDVPSPDPAEELRDYRIWTDASGKFTVEAKYAGIISGNVKLIKKDGKSVSLPIEKFGAADQDWLRNKMKKSR
jgi:hypothetical protein